MQFEIYFQVPMLFTKTYHHLEIRYWILCLLGLMRFRLKDRDIFLPF